MKVCVIGAGIVGCASAYQLARLGHDVHLIETREGPGLATSYANGAQLSYSYVEPLASPTTLRALPGMLLARSSPLRFIPQLDWRQWLWGLQFLRACTSSQVRRGTQELLALSRISRDTLENWMAEEHWSFSFQRNGKLVLCPNQASLDRQARQVQFQATLGCKQDILDTQACLAREPALKNYAAHFAGGVWTEDECVGDPHQLCIQMVDSLLRLGGRASFGLPVDDFLLSGDTLNAVKTPIGDITADAFVLAAGSHTTALAARLGIHLPIYPIKGYSITLPIKAGQQAPASSITDLSRKTVFAPLGQQLRVAAMAEITGHDYAISESRIAQMLTSVEAVFPGLCETATPMPWAGLRPATPTSIPIIGRSKIRKLYLNGGHGALGLTLAAGSAALLADSVSNGHGYAIPGYAIPPRLMKQAGV